MNRTILGAVGALVLLAAVAAGVAVSQRPPKPPNVLIVLWDTTRADRLTMYGYDLPTTPRMAKWAEEHGVVFEKAISPDMWTVPSHASLFTGQAPGTHGASFDHRWLDNPNVTLAEWFGQHGWDTYAFSANPNLAPKRINLLQGFEKIDTSWSRPWKDEVRQLLRRKLIRSDKSTEISPASERKGGVGYYNAGPVAHQALTTWLDARADQDKPFFAYLSYMEAHKPRVPFLDSRKKVADEDTVTLGLQTDLSLNSQLLYSYGQLSYTPEELEAVNRVYDAALVDLDNATADLLEDLEARGVLDDTIVVFTADHGEQLGEHQQFGHRAGVYQQLLHVPLVIAYPRKLAPRRVSVPTTNLQIFDTLLSLAGLPAPPTERVAGDLTQVKDDIVSVFSETLSIDKEGYARVRKLRPDIGGDVWRNTYQSVVEGKWKLIESVSYDDHSLVHCELYDLDADPGEQQNLFAQQADTSKAMMAKLADWKGKRPQFDEATAEKPQEKAHLSKQECEQLALLGYIDERCDELGNEPVAEAAPAEARGNLCHL